MSVETGLHFPAARQEPVTKTVGGIIFENPMLNALGGQQRRLGRRRQ
jgi:hypothetical protein